MYVMTQVAQKDFLKNVLVQLSMIFFHEHLETKILKSFLGNYFFLAETRTPCKWSNYEQ